MLYVGLLQLNFKDMKNETERKSSFRVLGAKIIK